MKVRSSPTNIRSLSGQVFKYITDSVMSISTNNHLTAIAAWEVINTSSELSNHLFGMRGDRVFLSQFLIDFNFIFGGVFLMVF